MHKCSSTWALLRKSKLSRKSPLSGYFSDFHGARHAQMGHDVECGRTDPCLRFLLRQGPRLHGVAEDALVALHGKLDRFCRNKGLK